MQAGVSERIVVRIAPENVDAQILAAGLVGSTIESLSVSKFVKVKLIDDGSEAFDIHAINSEEQFIPLHDFSQWSWDVLPLRRGTFKLRLLVTVRVKDGEETGDKDLPVYYRKICVKVNPVFSLKRFYKAHSESLWGLLFGSGVLGWIAKQWHAKRKPHTLYNP